MPRKKTEVRVTPGITTIETSCLADLEARLAAAEADSKFYRNEAIRNLTESNRLRKELKAAGVIIKTLRENRA